MQKSNEIYMLIESSHVRSFFPSLKKGVTVCFAVERFSSTEQEPRRGDRCTVVCRTETEAISFFTSVAKATNAAARQSGLVGGGSHLKMNYLNLLLGSW